MLVFLCTVRGDRVCTHVWWKVCLTSGYSSVISAECYSTKLLITSTHLDGLMVSQFAKALFKWYWHVCTIAMTIWVKLMFLNGQSVGGVNSTIFVRHKCVEI